MDNQNSQEEKKEDKPKPDSKSAAVEESEGSKVSNMPSGEFMLHVLIESGKGIQLMGEDVTDPLVKVSLCNKEKATSAKAGTTQTTQVIWDEHIFIETGQQTKANIEEAYIFFQVVNRGFFLDDMIGSFQIQASTIYKMAKHTVHNQLIQFTNPNSEDKGKITASITVSINLQGPGDEASQLKMGTDPEASKRKPWLPSSVKKNYKQLTFKWIKCQAIPMMDEQQTFDLTGAAKFGGDPYIKFEHSKNILKTKYVTIELDTKPENMILPPFDINQQMLIPIEIPVAKDKLTFDMWEFDKGVVVDGDRLICTFYQSLAEIFKDDSSKEPVGQNGEIKLKRKVKWIHLYGSNVFKEYKPLLNMAGFINKHALVQNTFQEAAPYYKGSILCEYSIIDCKNPEMKVTKAKNLNKEKIKKLQELSNYEVYFDINNAICLPETNDYKIRIQIGEHYKDTGKARQGKEQNMKFYNRWGERIVFSFQSFARYVNELPDVFIYLVDSDDFPVCFWKDKCQNYIDSSKKQFKWAQFTPDLAIDKVKEAHKSGIFSFKLYIHDNKNGKFDTKSSPAWQREPPKRLSSYKMRAYIYQGESLPIMDASGVSDPYIKVYSAQPDEQDLKTQIAEQTCNPIYYTTIDFNLEFNDANDACPIILDCFDMDASSMFGFGSSSNNDSFMGRSIIFMDKLKDLADDDHIPDPERCPVVQTMKDLENFDINSGPVILASFAKISNEDDYYFLPDLPYIKIENQINEADKQDNASKMNEEQNLITN